MILKGTCHCVGDNISTDDIIAEKYKSRIVEVQILCIHLMENIAPNFYNNFKKKDFLVAGKNFGIGSSREMAPLIIKTVGCSAVIAKSFARIFYRNSLNLGLRLIVCDTHTILDKDKIIVDTEKGKIKNLSNEKEIFYKPSSKQFDEMMEEGGVLRYFKKHRKFPETF